MLSVSPSYPVPYERWAQSLFARHNEEIAQFIESEILSYIGYKPEICDVFICMFSARLGMLISEKGLDNPDLEVFLNKNKLRNLDHWRRPSRGSPEVGKLYQLKYLRTLEKWAKKELETEILNFRPRDWGWFDFEISRIIQAIHFDRKVKAGKPVPDYFTEDFLIRLIEFLKETMIKLRRPEGVSHDDWVNKIDQRFQDRIHYVLEAIEASNFPFTDQMRIDMPGRLVRAFMDRDDFDDWLANEEGRKIILDFAKSFNLKLLKAV